jgi:hypothetical protein
MAVAVVRAEVPSAGEVVEAETVPDTTLIAAAAGGEGGAVAVTTEGGTVVAAARASTGLQLSEEVGQAAVAYKRGPDLEANPALLKLFVTDQRLTALWDEIETLEAEAANFQPGSQLLVTEMLERLTAARNMLLHRRDQYENARREVIYVRYRLTRIRHSSLLEQPQAILVYLVLSLILLGLGFGRTPQILAGLGNPSNIAGIDSITLLNSALWGGIGGLTAAFFALQRHVEDFDQQFARWYYISPIIGLFIGPLIGLVAGIGLPALFVLVGGQASDMQVAPALLYLLAWSVGFQQNLLLRLINTVFKQIFPAKDAAG